MCTNCSIFRSFRVFEIPYRRTPELVLPKKYASFRITFRPPGAEDRGRDRLNPRIQVLIASSPHGCIQSHVHAHRPRVPCARTYRRKASSGETIPGRDPPTSSLPLGVAQLGTTAARPHLTSAHRGEEPRGGTTLCGRRTTLKELALARRSRGRLPSSQPAPGGSTRAATPPWGAAGGVEVYFLSPAQR